MISWRQLLTAIPAATLLPKVAPLEASSSAVGDGPFTLLLVDDHDVRLPLKTFVHQRYVTAVLPRPVKIPAINANPLGG